MDADEEWNQNPLFPYALRLIKVLLPTRALNLFVDYAVMLTACELCFEILSNVVAVQVPCGHLYCNDCFRFLSAAQFPCHYQCCNAARTRAEDGIPVVIRVVVTSEGEDQMMVNRYGCFDRSVRFVS